MIGKTTFVAERLEGTKLSLASNEHSEPGLVFQFNGANEEVLFLRVSDEVAKRLQEEIDSGLFNLSREIAYQSGSTTP